MAIYRINPLYKLTYIQKVKLKFHLNFSGLWNTTEPDNIFNLTNEEVLGKITTALRYGLVIYSKFVLSLHFIILRLRLNE